jgi:hypothetical protein
MKSIHVLRKPCSEPTVAANVLRWGTGALNIDVCRVTGPPSSGGSTSGATALGQGSGWNAHANRPTGIDRSMGAGRWPSNIVLQHLDGCVNDGENRCVHLMDPVGQAAVQMVSVHPMWAGFARGTGSQAPMSLKTAPRPSLLGPANPAVL